MAGERSRAARPSSAKMWEDSEPVRSVDRHDRDRDREPGDARKALENTPTARYAGRKRSRSSERADLRGDTKRTRERSPTKGYHNSRRVDKDDRRSRRDERNDRDRSKRDEGATHGSRRDDGRERPARRYRDEKMEQSVDDDDKSDSEFDNSREPAKGPRSGGFRKPDFKLSGSVKPVEVSKAMKKDDEDRMEDVQMGEKPLEMDGETWAMMQAMGFSAFKSTKNTKVPGNDKNHGIRRDTQMKARQYMNRPGGFNRPLSPGR